ncbi:hypothetical protein GPAL_0380 [Glaciecola pallidula DSM 14239 = ACAM 615]|uniref:Uncharacterized protein n=1 Tax=Brumicola pallidula DSM 14239 = ACAM 615 TaxID=1121922 RepID=K6ZVA2_9ALTE|nr:hypothetical protein GPAL_0380 [Glaciecola pallidula DSM 14239 = ACAM 615]
MGSKPAVTALPFFLGSAIVLHLPLYCGGWYRRDDTHVCVSYRH